MEYIKLTDNEYKDNDDMPYEWYFEINTQNERLSERMIEVFSSGRINRITKEEYYNTVIELVPVPTVEEFNNGIWGDLQCASVISEAQFEEIWHYSVEKEN